MPKYNIYKIKKQQEASLIDKLKLVGLEEISKKEVNGFNLSFYFSQEPDKVDIWWTEIYRDFFENIEKPKNQLYFGILLISNETQCYAISLGKSHFYLKSFCDTDFGLNLAERIVDEGNLSIKNSKFHKSKKSKTLTTYQKGSEIDYESGESIHYLKAQTIDKETWGEVACFGNSVQLNLQRCPTELPDLVNIIEEELKKLPLFELPKTDPVLDEEKISELDEKLADAIIKKGEKSNIQVDEFSIYGVEFIFPDRSNYSFCLKGDSRNKTKPSDLSIENLIAFINENAINLSERLNDINVFVHNEHGRAYSQPLKFFLDFVDDERHCLVDGKWHKFNQSYLKYLMKEVDKLSLIYEDVFDVEKGTSEDSFNKAREANDGFRNCDKVLEVYGSKYKVEKMDLYKENVLYFVKIENPQKLSYVIDQAVNTVKLLQNNESIINIDDKDVEVKGICLWMIIPRKKISKLSEINSIILHMKLVEWKKVVTYAGYKPIIWLNYVKTKV